MASVAVLIAGASFAAIPSSDGTIYACYAKDTRVLRVLDKEAGKSCTAKQVEMHWNQEGTPGADGSPGPQGLPGERGPEGPAGSLIQDRIRLAGNPVLLPTSAWATMPRTQDSWTQNPGEINLLFERVAFDPGPTCLGNQSLTADVLVDGQRAGYEVIQTTPNSGPASSSASTSTWRASTSGACTSSTMARSSTPWRFGLRLGAPGRR